MVPSASHRSKEVFASLRQPLLAMAALTLHSFLAGVTKCWTTAKQGASANDAPNELVSVLLHSGDGSFSLRAHTGTSQKLITMSQIFIISDALSKSLDFPIRKFERKSNEDWASRYDWLCTETSVLTNLSADLDFSTSNEYQSLQSISIRF